MNDELRDLIRMEAENADIHMNEPATPGETLLHPGGFARTYTIRLTEKNVAALEQAAKQIGVKPSALARDWIIERLAQGQVAPDTKAIADTLAVFARQLAATP